jgi:phosphatidylserine decarboxylase
MHWTNALSRLVGRVAGTRFPPALQRTINQGYVSLVGVDMSDFAPVETYPTLNDFFARRLVKPRVFDAKADTLIGPCDSTVQGYGRLNSDMLLQVKGLEYSVRDLLTPQARHAERASNGAFLSLYLSPRAYHGYHAPATLHVERLIHVPGKLVPVAPFVANRSAGVFARNERVILEARRLSGQHFWMVFVGATNVGSMGFEMEPSLQTNVGTRDIRVYECGGRLVEKGEYLGAFRLGSSILLIADTRVPAPSNLGVTRVQFGDPLPWPPNE